MQDFYFFLAVVIVVVFFYALASSPFGRGKIGEWIVSLTLGKTIENQQYVINNIIIKDENDKTSQIDHILINPKGIFVIETKNYSGRIYGNEKQIEWTQVLAYGKVKNKLYNPIKQNNTHIYRLKNQMPNYVVFYSAVVFVKGNTHFIQSNKVLKLRQLKNFIRLERDVNLSEKQMKECYEILCNIKNETTVTTKEHINNINTLKKNIENDICPKCGAKLVERQGKYGAFKGCSQYPKCTYTKK